MRIGRKIYTAGRLFCPYKQMWTEHETIGRKENWSMENKETKELKPDELGEVSGGMIRIMNDGERVLNEAGIREIAARFRSRGASRDDVLASIREKSGCWIRDKSEQTLYDMDCRIRNLVDEVFKG